MVTEVEKNALKYGGKIEGEGGGGGGGGRKGKGFFL